MALYLHLFTIFKEVNIRAMIRLPNVYSGQGSGRLGGFPSQHWTQGRDIGWMGCQSIEGSTHAMRKTMRYFN